MSDKIELRLYEWNSFVSDETQCASLGQRDEVALLPSKSSTPYLKLYPTMANELMVPSGFQQRLIRRYERHLGSTQLLSTQNGAAKKAQWDNENFDTLLPGTVKVVSNPAEATTIPTWRELCHHVCTNSACTIDGEAMAPQYDYPFMGETVRIIKYGMLEIEVSEKQWHLMWDHVVCQFAKPYSGNVLIDPTTPDQMEFIALHNAYAEIASIPRPWKEWQWPIGQQIAIILKQLEARLKGAHERVPTWHCDFASHAHGSLNAPFQEFLNKEEAAGIVCDAHLNQGRSPFAIDYDPAIRTELKKKGVDLLFVKGDNNKGDMRSVMGRMGRLCHGNAAGGAKKLL